MKHFYTLFVICLAFSSWINDVTARTVNIPDANLASAVREALGLGPDAPITQQAMQQLTTLNGIEDPITDLTGLEHATQLEVFSLSYSHHNPISDLTPLEGLTQLRELRFGYSNQIGDLTPLDGLTQLRQLGLGAAPISDLTPLKQLTLLDMFSVACSDISDLTPLKNLQNLTSIPSPNYEVVN